MPQKFPYSPQYSRRAWDPDVWLMPGIPSSPSFLFVWVVAAAGEYGWEMSQLIPAKVSGYPV